MERNTITWEPELEGTCVPPCDLVGTILLATLDFPQCETYSARVISYPCFVFRFVTN
jgi:hypothetical protein